jgi:hypothetical protein
MKFIRSYIKSAIKWLLSLIITFFIGDISLIAMVIPAIIIESNDILLNNALSENSVKFGEPSKIDLEIIKQAQDIKIKKGVLPAPAIP